MIRRLFYTPIPSLIYAAIFMAFLVGFLQANGVQFASAETLAVDDNGYRIQVLELGTVQKIAYTGTEGETSAWDTTKGTVTVRVVCTTNCHILCASAPAAATTDTFLPAFTPEYLKVNATHVCAVIQNTSAGDAYFTEMK